MFAHIRMWSTNRSRKAAAIRPKDFFLAAVRFRWHKGVLTLFLRSPNFSEERRIFDFRPGEFNPSKLLRAAYNGLKFWGEKKREIFFGRCIHPYPEGHIFQSDWTFLKRVWLYQHILLCPSIRLCHLIFYLEQWSVSVHKRADGGEAWKINLVWGLQSLREMWTDK